MAIPEMTPEDLDDLRAEEKETVKLESLFIENVYENEQEKNLESLFGEAVRAGAKLAERDNERQIAKAHETIMVLADLLKLSGEMVKTMATALQDYTGKPTGAFSAFKTDSAEE